MAETLAFFEFVEGEAAAMTERWSSVDAGDRMSARTGLKHAHNGFERVHWPQGNDLGSRGGRNTRP